MSLRTRPILSNRQFTQPADEYLELSGTTNFVGSVEIKGIKIDTDITNINIGSVLKYNGEKILLVNEEPQSLTPGFGLSLDLNDNIQLGNLNTADTIKISLTDKVNNEGVAIYQIESIIGDNLSRYSDFTISNQNIPNRFWESYREISAQAFNSEAKNFSKSASLTIQAQTAINNGALSFANIGAGGLSLEFYSFRDGNTNVDETYARFRDFTNQRGVEYASDYEANFLPRTLITKQYADGLFNSLTANNGVQRILNNLSVDSTVLRTSGEQIKTALLRFRFGGIGERLVGSHEYPDNTGEDYNLRLYSNAQLNNVGYYWKQVFTLAISGGSERLDLPMIGFKNGIVSIGSETYPLGSLGIETYYNNQTSPVIRNPLSLYVTGQSLFTNRIYAGKSDFTNTLFLTTNDTLYSEGTIYARLGLRTRDAENLSILDSVAWDLGNYSIGTTLTQSHTAFIRIDGKLFKIALEEVI